MLGYQAAEVVNKISPSDIHDPQEVIERAQALSLELATTITPAHTGRWRMPACGMPNPCPLCGPKRTWRVITIRGCY